MGTPGPQLYPPYFLQYQCFLLFSEPILYKRKTSVPKFADSRTPRSGWLQRRRSRGCGPEEKKSSERSTSMPLQICKLCMKKRCGQLTTRVTQQGKTTMYSSQTKFR